MAGLLTCFSPDAFPSYILQTVAGVLSGSGYEAYSSGTVRDFHPIPFYFLYRMITRKPVWNKDTKKMKC